MQVSRSGNACSGASATLRSSRARSCAKPLPRSAATTLCNGLRWPTLCKWRACTSSARCSRFACGGSVRVPLLLMVHLQIGVDWRVTGAAAQHALQQKFFRTAFGSLLLRFPSLLSMCTTLVLYWEFWAPFALLLPLSWARVWFVATAALLHVCFGVAMRLGLLVWVPLIALVPLLPGFVWTWVARVHLKSRRAPLVLLVDLESSWLGSRVLFFFHSFLLVDASIEWAHLDGGGGAVGGAPARSPTEWLAVSSLPHGTRLSNADALEELVLATPLPGATVLASVVHRVAIVLGGVLAAVGRIRDDDSPLRYKRPPRAQPVLPGAPARSAAAVPNAALEDLAWLRGLGRVVVASWVVLAMVFVVRHNLSTAGLVGPHGPYWNALGSLCGLHQSWDMFAPNPAQSYWWYRVVARSDAGNPLSLADQGLFQWQAQPLERSLQEPHSLWAHFEGSHRLFKYFETGINTNVAGVRSRFGRFMCAQWNARQLPRIASLELYQHVIPLAPGAEPLDHLLWEDKCSDALASTATASPTPTVAPTPAPSAPVVSRPVPPAPPVVATVFPVLAEPTVAVGATMVVVANNINNAPPAVAAVDTRPRASASVHESIDRSAPWATVLTSVAPPPAAPGAAASRIGAPAASAPAGAQAAGPQMHALALAWAGLDLKKEAPLTAPPAPAAKHGPLTAPPVSEPLAGKWVRGKWVPT